MVKLTDKYISALTVQKLTDKKFKILGPGGMEQLPQADGKTQEKLVLPIELSNGTEILYIPNNTSMKTLRKKYGDETSNWKDKSAEFELAKQNVRGEMKDIIFVKK